MGISQVPAVGLISLWCLGPVVAAPESSEQTGWLAGRLAGESVADQIWSAGTLYRNPDGAVFQDLAITGQLQNQFARGSDGSGNFGTGDLPEPGRWGNIEVRRFRLGGKGKLFDKLSFLYLADLNGDFEPRIYKRSPEANVTWTENDAFQLSLGKSELKFDREQEFSSKEFPLFERTALGNMFYAGELTGVWATGKNIAGGWLYHIGVCANDRVDEWGEFDGGEVWLAKVGYNYSKAVGFDQAEVKFQWLHNMRPGFVASSSNPSSPPYADCLSISNEIKEGPFGLTVEGLWGDGEQGRSDVYGISLVPFWNITEKLQWISDIELAGSSGEDGIVLPYRYEAQAPGVGDAQGDGYFAFYSGLTYFVRGHDLKLMSGAKYTHMDGGPGGGDFRGWTWLAGVRMAF